MISRLLRQIRVVWQFLTPNAQTRSYTRTLQSSGHFDRTFYLRSNPRLRRLFRLAPERHYVLFGEPAGLCPNANFSPRAYLFNNPDLTANAKFHPLLHYIKTGQAQSRVVLRSQAVLDLALPAIDATMVSPANPASVAVALHLYYHDMWPEFARTLLRQDFTFDLYITATGSEADVTSLRQQVQADFPQAKVWAMPNHGRDIFPFIHLIQANLFAPYQAICKLHSKKSPHRDDGDSWRQNLTAGVIGDPIRTKARLQTFLANPQIGLWVADGQYYQGEEWWGCNQTQTRKILTKVGLDITGCPLAFPAGSIYWLKPPLVAQLKALNLSISDFEVEQALVDGTTAHAIERAMGYLTSDAGLKLAQSSQLDHP